MILFFVESWFAEAFKFSKN